MMDYRTLADVVLVFHLGFALFIAFGFGAVILGGLLGWGFVRGFWFRLLHLLAMGFVAFEAVVGMVCPLTEWEYRLRVAGGDSPEQMAFIPRLARKILFYDLPPSVFLVSYLVLAFLVLALWWVVPPKKKGKNLEG